MSWTQGEHRLPLQPPGWKLITTEPTCYSNSWRGGRVWFIKLVPHTLAHLGRHHCPMMSGLLSPVPAQARPAHPPAWPGWRSACTGRPEQSSWGSAGRSGGSTGGSWPAGPHKLDGPRTAWKQKQGSLRQAVFNQNKDQGQRIYKALNKIMS